MRKTRLFLAIVCLLLALPASSLAATRALLAACSDFVSQPDLGNASSGNLQMIGSALLGVSPRLQGLSIEDGTLASPEALSSAVQKTFGDAAQEDLSILYLCTHGISSSDDGRTYLLLSDGETESTLSAEQLFAMLSGVRGEKLLILDACFSGGIIGRGALGRPPMPAASPMPAPPARAASSPFLKDPSIHVLTSASGHESSWYYDAQHLATGAVSYFASALVSGLGLYGSAEADLSGNGQISLDELHRYLSTAVPSSSCQLLSADAKAVSLPAVARTSLSRPLSGFSYGDLLLSAEEPTLDFSFTVTRETAVQYRLIDFDAGAWDWENAKTFLDTGDNSEALLAPGRHSRTLALQDVAPEESGYLMLQIFAVSGEDVLLCSERLIAVQPAQSERALALRAPDAFSPEKCELEIGVLCGAPAEVTVSVYDGEGELVRRLCRSQLTHPAPGNLWPVYWDGRNDDGRPALPGAYTVTAEAYIGGTRQKACLDLTIEQVHPR